MLKNVKYLLTTHLVEEMPQDDIPEVVIAGKSNVGKSTLINVLTNNKKMAKISSRPGKTQAISLFDIEGRVRLVDVPGYGYAKVSKKQLKSFSKIIDKYLTNRLNISKAILLLDMRRGITKDDWDLINFFYQLEIPFTIVGTKRDKVNQSERSKFNKQIKEELSTSVINYSSITKQGLSDIEEIFYEYE